MYIPHPYINTPNDSTVIWRYMDLWKFLDILDNKHLYLPNCGSFDDQLEGQFPIKDFQKKDTDRYLKILDKFSATNYKNRTFISSWNKDISEKYPLWKIYSNYHTAVAIKTTIGDLKETLEADNRHQYIGKVEYHIEGTEFKFNGNMNHLIFTKRNYFEFEKEVRIVTRLEDYTSLKKVPKYILVKLKSLSFIKEIKLAPLASKSFKNLIELKLSSLSLETPITFSDI